MSLALRTPTHDDEAQLRALHQELAAEDFDFLLADGPWPDVLDAYARAAAGVALPPGRVRSKFLVAEVDDVIVGRTSIRYELTESLRRFGGHVGYAVGPRFRRRGYATRILELSLERLRAAGVEEVLVTCADDNLASIGTIEACGGRLENVEISAEGRPTRRYWIG